MEVSSRGLVEKLIDRITQINELAKMAELIQKEFPVESLKDCVLGYVVGTVLGCYVTIVGGLSGKAATQAEIDEFWDVIRKRTMYIKGQIKLATGK